ncbi:MAG: hypothetical protein AAGL49_08805, partial [Pseudomonadota bacterium]
ALSREAFVSLISLADPADADPASELAEAPGPLTRARMYAAIEASPSPAAQAEAIGLTLASSDDVLVRWAMARLYREALLGLDIDPALGPHASSFALALLAAGEIDAGGRWATSAPPGAPADLTTPAPGAPAKPLDAAAFAKLMHQLLAGQPISDAAGEPTRDMKVLLAVAGGADLPVQPEASLLADEPVLVAPVLRAALLSASFGGRIGEAGLAAALSLGRDDLGATPLPALVDTIAALRIVGLERHARLIAFEAMWARWLEAEALRPEDEA